jgi:predicted nucleic acid-binding protein
MSEAILDTNAWNVLVRGDQLAGRIVEALAGAEATVSVVALAELASLEVRGLVKSDPVGKVLAQARVVPFTQECAIEAGRLHGKLRRAGNTKVSLADVMMYVSAQQAKATFITFDPDLKGRPGVRFVKP